MVSEQGKAGDCCACGHCHTHGSIVGQIKESEGGRWDVPATRAEAHVEASARHEVGTNHAASVSIDRVEAQALGEHTTNVELIVERSRAQSACGCVRGQKREAEELHSHQGTYSRLEVKASND